MATATGAGSTPALWSLSVLLFIGLGRLGRWMDRLARGLLGAPGAQGAGVGRGGAALRAPCGRTSGACGRTSSLFGALTALVRAARASSSRRCSSGCRSGAAGPRLGLPGHGLGGRGHRRAGQPRQARLALRGPGRRGRHRGHGAAFPGGAAMSAPAPRLSRRVVWRVFLRSLFLQASWNPAGHAEPGARLRPLPGARGALPRAPGAGGRGAPPPGLLQHPPLRGRGHRGRGAPPRAADRPGRGVPGHGGGLQGGADGARWRRSATASSGCRSSRRPARCARRWCPCSPRGRRCSSWCSTTSSTSPSGRSSTCWACRWGTGWWRRWRAPTCPAGGRSCAPWPRRAREGWRPGWPPALGPTWAAASPRCCPLGCLALGGVSYLLVARRVPSYLVLYLAAGLACAAGAFL